MIGVKALVNLLPLSYLFYNALFEIFGKVHLAYTFCGIVGCYLGHVVFNHELYKLLEGGGLRVQAEFGFGLGWVAPKVDHIGGAVEVFGYCYNHLSCSNINTLLVDSFAFPSELDAGMMESEGGELAYGMLHASGDDEVFRGVVLEDEPHAFYIILGISPVAKRIEVAEIEAVLFALGDTGSCKGDLAGDEGFASAFGLVIEEDAGAAEHIVGFTVFLDYPITIELCHSIGRVWMEGGVLVLGHFFYLAIELGGRCLIDTAGILKMVGAHCLKDTKHAHCIYIGCELRCIEAYLHVGLCGKVINLIRQHFAHEFNERHGVGHVGIVKVEMWGSFQMSYSFAIIHRRPADDAMDFVAFSEEELR